MTVTATATFCATLVDEWVRAGLAAAFLAPGSRSTPLALALAANPGIDLHLFHDERGAAFAALGHGLATQRPAVVLCTSGTAAAHFHAAIIEADLSSVPLIACTADRPPELWNIGAPQTIDQTKLYGDSARWYAEPGAPDPVTASTWRSLGSQAVAEARGWAGRPGPVHLNLSFRDPLVGDPGELPPGRADGSPWHRTLGPIARNTDGGAGAPAGDRIEVVAAALHHDRRARPGVIIAGHGTGEPEAVLALARRLGWPVLADHRSGCRVPGRAITYFDAILRSPAFTRSARPQVVLRFGESLASKVLGQWIGTSEAEVISVVDRSRWSDPERAAGWVVAAGGVASALNEALPPDLGASDDAARWAEADRRAGDAVVAARTPGSDAENGPTEIDIAQQVVSGVVPGGALVLSSSMPVRDVEWFGPNRDDILVLANRGANGIDGVIATAIGVASSGRPTTVLIGDVALLHDSTSLVALARRELRLDIVVIDNDGGGIFSFLPQASQLGGDTFERLFGTPHGTDLAALARAHGLEVSNWPLKPAGEGDGTRIVIVETDRAANVIAHDEVNRAVAAALEGRG